MLRRAALSVKKARKDKDLFFGGSRFIDGLFSFFLNP
jgi:hypothetical protein